TRTCATSWPRPGCGLSGFHERSTNFPWLTAPPDEHSSTICAEDQAVCAVYLTQNSSSWYCTLVVVSPEIAQWGRQGATDHGSPSHLLVWCVAMIAVWQMIDADTGLERVNRPKVRRGPFLPENHMDMQANALKEMLPALTAESLANAKPPGELTEKEATGLTAAQRE